MEELGAVLARAVRGILSTLPGEIAIAAASVLALAALLRAGGRRVPLNSAFTRRTAGVGENREAEDPERSRIAHLRRI